MEDIFARTVLHDGSDDCVWLVMGTLTADKTNTERLHFYLFVIIKHTLGI